MIGRARSSLTLVDLLEVVSEFDILSYYFNVSTIPCVINSPIRKDNKPSLGLYSKDGIKIYYKDFSEHNSGGTFDLMSSYFGLNFSDTIEKIYRDMKCNTSKVIHSIKKTGYLTKCSYSKSSKVEVRVRNWRKHDLEYWKTFGISLKWLKFGNIYPISHILITKSDITSIISAEKYAYAYAEFKDDIPTLKIYQPYSLKYKWSCKHDSSVWDLWKQLPKKGNNLIITSSRKDALCIWANTGIPSCSLQGEGYLPKPHIIEQLKSRFTNIFILYDNDFKSEINHGRELGSNIAAMFKLIQIEIPDEYLSKDPSDLYKNKGRDTLIKVINQLITK